MSVKEWTEEQLKAYKGMLYINREFSDYGFAFGEELQIFTEESNTKPVYRQVFYGDGDCEEFLESLGFLKDGSENGWVRLPEGFKIPDRLLNVDLYKSIVQIGNLIFEYVSDEVTGDDTIPWLQNRRGGEPNPFYNQTESGLFLEMYYGTPSKLWTPWGTVEIGGSGCGNFEEVDKKILERLGAVMHVEMAHDPLGTYGPIYRLTKVDDQPLPEAKVVSPDSIAEYDTVKIAWIKVSEEASEPPKKEGPFSLEGLEPLEIPKFELKVGV